MRFSKMITAVDAYAAGEPGRVIVGGVLDVPGETMLAKAIYFEQKNLKEAIGNIQKCLKMNPSYPNAQKIYNALLNIYQQQ